MYSPPCGPVPLRAFIMRWRIVWYCSLVSSHGLMSSTVNDRLPKAGGLVGKGCVGAEDSPATSVFGTARSSIGQSGSPVTRLKTYRNPVLPAWATAGIVRPF